MAGKAKSIYLTITKKGSMKTEFTKTFFNSKDFNDYIKTEEFKQKWPDVEYSVIKEVYQMKTVRRKFTIFEKMDLELLENMKKGPVTQFLLTSEEFREFTLTENGRASFKKITGRINDEVGGDWTYKGALVVLNDKFAEEKVK